MMKKKYAEGGKKPLTAKQKLDKEVAARNAKTMQGLKDSVKGTTTSVKPTPKAKAKTGAQLKAEGMALKAKGAAMKKAGSMTGGDVAKALVDKGYNAGKNFVKTAAKAGNMAGAATVKGAEIYAKNTALGKTYAKGKSIGKTVGAVMSITNKAIAAGNASKTKPSTTKATTGAMSKPTKTVVKTAPTPVKKKAPVKKSAPRVDPSPITKMETRTSSSALQNMTKVPDNAKLAENPNPVKGGRVTAKIAEVKANMQANKAERQAKRDERKAKRKADDKTIMKKGGKMKMTKKASLPKMKKGGKKC